MTRAEEAASIGAYGWQADEDGNLSIEMFPETFKRAFIKGYKQAEKDIISIIESRISEIIGDAQPAPVLRAELRELINKIEEK